MHDITHISGQTEGRKACRHHVAGAVFGKAASGPILKLLAFLMLTNTDPFAAWLVVTGNATPGGIRVVRSDLGAVSSLPIVAFREKRAARGEEGVPPPRRGTSPSVVSPHDLLSNVDLS